MGERKKIAFFFKKPLVLFITTVYKLNKPGFVNENCTPNRISSKLIGTRSTQAKKRFSTMPQFTLKVIQGKLAGEEFVFEENGLCMVGRDPNCSISIPREKDIAISRMHCLLIINPDEISIRDLYSTNGTYVNNSRLLPSAMGNQPEEKKPNDRILVDGDKISIGNLVIQLKISESGDSSSGTKVSPTNDDPIPTTQTTKTRLIAFANRKTRGDSLIPETNTFKRSDLIQQNTSLQETHISLSMPITEAIPRPQASQSEKDKITENKSSDSKAMERKPIQPPTPQTSPPEKRIEPESPKTKPIPRIKEKNEIADKETPQKKSDETRETEKKQPIEKATIEMKKEEAPINTPKKEIVEKKEQIPAPPTEPAQKHAEIPAKIEDESVKKETPETKPLEADEKVESSQDTPAPKPEPQALFNPRTMRSMEQLAGTIAHDYNKQLSVIKGYTELLKNAQNPDKIKDYADKIAHSAQLSAELTEELIVFASNEKTQGGSVDLSEMLTEIVSVMKHTAGRDIDIEYDIPNEHRIYHTTGNQLEIHDALLNIAINAVEAIPETGTISFTITPRNLNAEDISTLGFQVKEGDYVQISISDTGTGISDDNSQHIFEPFFTTKQEKQALGMGLSVVYGIIKQHNGTLDLTTSPEKGTRFDIYLPSSDKLDLTITQKQVTKDDFKKLDATVLVIYDEKNMRSLITEMLHLFNINVKTAINKNQALKTYQEETNSIGLVIIDMNISHEIENEMYLELKKINQAVKILFSSNHKQPLSPKIQEEMKNGKVEYLQKPYSTSSLYDSVYTLLT